MRIVAKGFTLIELMITVAIVGILTAIAIPAYQDYVTRSKVSEALSSAAAFKTAIWDFYSQHGKMPANQAELGIANVAMGKYIISRHYNFLSDTTSEMVMTFSADSGLAKGQTLVFAAAATVSGFNWECTGGSLHARHRPFICRP